MAARLRCPYRALGLGVLMMGLGMLAGGPPASADLAVDVPTVPTVPAVTTPTTISVGDSTPTTVAVDAGSLPTDPLTTDVTVPPAVGETVSGATDTLTATMDPALASIVSSVQGVLSLINGTVNGLLPVDKVAGGGGSSSGGSGSGGSGASAESARVGGADAGAASVASGSAAGSDGRGSAGGRIGGTATGSMPSAHDLASLRKAAVQAAEDFALPFLLGVLALGYLIFQSRTERHEPRLASDSGEELLRFR